MEERPKGEGFPDFARQVAHQRSDPLLADLERQARERSVPILGAGAAGFVAGLARTKAGHALELGSAIGYTSVWLGRVAREAGGQVTTVDHDAAMVRAARAAVERAGLDGVVEVVQADALEFLQGGSEAFDLILLDIDKHEYAAAEPFAAGRLRPGGILVADNASFPDAREFLSLLLGDERLDTSLLYGFWPGHSPEWDAMSVSVRKSSGTGSRVGVLG